MAKTKPISMPKTNKMGSVPMSKLIWQMGLPMIVSMVLQSIYNIVDTIFVINMGPDGVAGNAAITCAFPIQLLIIALGVGTGVGINALLSKKLGEKDKDGVSRVAGNGIFLGLCMYIIFLIFGLLGAKWFIGMQSADSQVINMGTQYLTICCTLSFGAIGYTVYERFLQATGKTMLSTISQIAGAATNILLDWVFIYPCNMGVAGAAWATIIGQIVSLLMAMIFHYTLNKEISGRLKYIAPKWDVIKGIFKIGISAAIMQGLLAVMMFGMNLILKYSALLFNSFGIYYKIMQLALFAAFGISNTIISVLSFNYGMQNKERSKKCIFWGIVDSLIVSVVIIVLFQCLASPLAQLFGMASTADAAVSADEIQKVVVIALRISSISYIFMAASVAIQGVLQAFRYSWLPLIISLLRLCVLVLPIAYLFTKTSNPTNNLWWTFLIVEAITAAVSFAFLRYAYKRKVSTMSAAAICAGKGLIVTLSRQHGSNGKQIGKLVAEKLGLSFYDKEILAQVAKDTGLAEEHLKDVADKVTGFNSLYLSTATNQQAIIAQAKVIRQIAEQGNCLIVGRGADYILKDYPNVINVFVYASQDYRVQTLNKLYGDDEASAIKQIKRADTARSVYYNFISGSTWGKESNYHLFIDGSNGAEATADAIVEFITAETQQKPAGTQADSQPTDQQAQHQLAKLAQTVDPKLAVEHTGDDHK